MKEHLPNDGAGPEPSRGFLGRSRDRFNVHVRRTVLTGTLLLVPVALTYLILKFIFDVVNGVLQPSVQWVLGQFGVEWRLPGAGLAVAVVLIYVAGFLVANALGLRIAEKAQDALLRVPLIGNIYSASRKLVESFSPGRGETGFKRVVMLQYPRVGYWSIGFLTAITVSESEEYAVVYIPTAPLPNSGWVAVVPVAEVYDTDLTVQGAMQIVFSGGIVTPEEIRSWRLVQEREETWTNTLRGWERRQPPQT